MFHRRILFSTFTAVTLLSSSMVHAAVSGTAPAHGKPGPDQGIQLAQMGEIDVYYDKYGRQVLVDRSTGEVVSVEPRRLTRQEWRRQQRALDLDRQDEFLGEDPGYEDGVVLERPRLRRQGEGSYERGQRFEEYPDSLDEFPAAPDDQTFEPRELPRSTRQQSIERKPLDDAATAPRGGSKKRTETAIAEPDYGEPTGSTGRVEEVPPATVAEPSPSFASRPEVAALQVLLDRKGASPGVIDGRFGSNVDKALAAYRALTGDNLKSTDAEGVRKRLAESGGDAFADYQITAEDAAGPYIASVPEDYSAKAKLDRMSFTSVTEMLAERFHMDEAYLKALNPEANFNRPGTIIKVANFGQLASTPVVRIIADKGRKQVRAYDAAGKLVVVYPATIGSSDTPSPTGIHAVSRVALDPNYTYNPKINFKQGENNQVLTIPPGPNGPVGSVWIALDKPTYGIHGTPEPSKIGKTESHGCVRLTNWDARELAKLVKPGVPVEFVE